MSYYKLIESYCHEIETMIANYSWGSKDGNRKIIWLSWDKLARAKGASGMGFQGIYDFSKR